ncbi:sugar transferase [Sphingopyxis sp. XHP0097]|uniref:Sugar transferase n=1 Tax=Sphingopyxis jiangsuensis TaxID=2871171 RepID=A0ABS7MBE1_9SPHN|nr:sugar transferase [Sphingopyxis jiangsuensis]MBY4636081.1 sugar transferase [Sphingopyxis jiangsuensis]
MIVDTSRPYDFIVTGASGKIGRHLVPLLARNGRTLLAVGRNSDTLRRLFANQTGSVAVADYGDLKRLPGCDTLIHLAVRNNDAPGTLADFSAVNVDFASQIAREFSRMNGRRFLNISSILALDDFEESPYAVSKAIGKRAIHDIIGDRLDNVHIGYFHDRGYFGERLAFLSRFGPAVGGMIFALLKMLKPATSAQSLVDYALGEPHSLPPPGILTDDLSRSRAYRAISRSMDLGVGLGILLLFLPVFAVIWIAIRLDSPGPAIFAQQRVGAAQIPFTLYKFRTMKRDTVAAGTHEVSSSAVTRIGAFLRRTKLDELPQAINLLRGNMTLVGPRPCLYSQTELMQAREALGVYALKPGITGYAQIREIDMSRPIALARSDHRYKKLRSLLLDLRIIVATALGRGGGDRITASDQV